MRRPHETYCAHALNIVAAATLPWRRLLHCCSCCLLLLAAAADDDDDDDDDGDDEEGKDNGKDTIHGNTELAFIFKHSLR